MKHSIIYVVVNEGDVVYASADKESANAYADTKGIEARESVLEEWGNDDPSESELAEADYQAGFDGDYYEVQKIDISNQTEDGTVELQDGTEIEMSEILEKLEMDD